MPRRARIVVPGEMYHVTQRGNYCQRIFEDDVDRAHYLKLVEEYKNKNSLELFAFCLMDNHVHFIVKPLQDDSLAQTFCRCHQRYAAYMHKKRKTTGHLWQERFYSCLLYGEHIRQAIKYVERNPVRAKMVAHPWDYKWSSARAHLGVKYHIVTLSDCSKYVGDCYWMDFIGADQPEDQVVKIRENTRKGSVLGTIEQINDLELKLGRNILPRLAGRPKISDKISDRHEFLTQDIEHDQK